MWLLRAWQKSVQKTARLAGQTSKMCYKASQPLSPFVLRPFPTPCDSFSRDLNHLRKMPFQLTIIDISRWHQTWPLPTGSDLRRQISWPHWRNSLRRSRAYKSRHFKYIHWITSICDFLSIITNWKHKTSFTTTHDATPIGIMNYLNFILQCRRNTNCCWHDGTSFRADLELKTAFCGEVNLKSSWQFMISAFQGVYVAVQQRIIDSM